MYQVAFYNLENFFEIHPYSNTSPHEFSPNGKMKWGEYRFEKKVEKVGKAIKLLEEKTKIQPLFIGLAEIESKAILDRITSFRLLEDSNYKSIHFNSKYERGLDVALLYNANLFEILASEPIEVLLKKTGSKKVYSRDILYVKGKVAEEILHVFVNHWPSKRKGSAKKEAGRVEASFLVQTKIEAIRAENPDAKIIVLGDFNINPNTELMRDFALFSNLINPMTSIYNENTGTLKFQGRWHLFDQILFSDNLLKSKSFKFQSAHIFTDPYLIGTRNEKTKEPNRTYFGKNYIGGISDHFPVYALFE
ncbi:endonuclease [Aureivirga sp. CE67]|uniref:endonuclease/exonuclease/phosphatase family protein n=1 Tax=Aureivirga sp. CE67 TaxID=1788983 RepID=UPI0018CA7F95|nr:endonuclease [Aureivirga sp. CE67]